MGTVVSCGPNLSITKNEFILPIALPRPMSEYSCQVLAY